MGAIVVADGVFKETQRDRTFEGLDFLANDEIVVDDFRFGVACSGKP